MTKGGCAVIKWQGPGVDSKTESSRGFYKLARVMPNIFIAMWLILILADILFLVRAKSFWLSFLVVFLGPFLIMGSIVWGIRYLAYRYASYVRITSAGLEVTRGKSTTVHPWSTVGEIRTLPFVQPALWAVKFRDGSPTVAFFTDGSFWLASGMEKAKSMFVDEVRRRVDEEAMLMNERSIGCYRDKGGVIMIAPWAKNEAGVGVPVNHVEILPCGFTPADLGARVLAATRWCDYAFVDPAVKYPAQVAAGEKGPRVFAKKWDLVEIRFTTEIRVSASTKDHMGRYAFLFREAELLPLDVEGEALGDAILRAFTHCRLGPRDY